MRQVQSIHSVAFAMAISLTLFACSDSSSGDDNEVSSSSSELNEESSSSVEELSSSSSELNEESSSSSEDLSSSSEAESSSSDAEASSSSVGELSSSSSELNEESSSSSEAESSSSEAESSSSEAESSSSEAESSSSEVSSSSSFEEDGTLGTLDDDRDYKTYSTVVIGSQVWMAENLNYNASGSKCYNNEESKCDVYGRLYDWATAMTTCPTGWHLPSDAEWTKLINYVDSTPGTKLKASSGWIDYNGNSGNGTDDYGFSALPGGYGHNGNFNNVGSDGYWWSATENSASNAHIRRMYYNNEVVGRLNYDKNDLYSVRCVQD